MVIKPITRAPITPVSMHFVSGEKSGIRAAIVPVIIREPTTVAKAAMPLSRLANPIPKPMHSNKAKHNL